MGFELLPESETQYQNLTGKRYAQTIFFSINKCYSSKDQTFACFSDGKPTKRTIAKVTAQK